MSQSTPRPARHVLSLLACTLAWAPSAGAFAPSVAACVDPAPTQDARPALSDDDRALLAEERAECDRLRRRGDLRAAVRRLGELLDEDPADAESLVIRARCRFDEADYERALADARAAFDAASTTAGASRDASKTAPGDARAAALRVEAEVLTALGRANEARARLSSQKAALAPAIDARDAWAIGSAAWAAGARDEARTALDLGASTGDAQSWDALLARGECEHRLGRLEAASKSLVLALDVAKAAGAEEPDALAALGDLYFEADKEVAEAKRRSAADLYRAALQLHPTHERAQLGLFALHRYNWQRQRVSAADLLTQALTAHPKSVETLLVALSTDLADGQLKSARERLAILLRIAPGRREVRTLRAALDWIDHKESACRDALAELAAEDPRDSTPEREVGRHLLELYRFAEGLPFVKAATERDPTDWEAWTQLGRALANTGDEVGAAAALDSAQKAAAGRQDAWRNNMALVLRNMKAHVTSESGDLTFSWDPDGGEVLSEYLIPFYVDARAELSKRYGFTPTPTRIEVFRRHKDFSVRSTGFEGFPALGVCFGPVVTAVSPLWEMRGTQSWARTSFHEFTHVIHLGLSHNRCPRWITEGLATWEEVNRNPSWTRNMRRELVDSIANDDVIPVRELNRAFRGPRILFGYYQGGLLCTMLIERYGFARIVKFLEAFDRGLDLDAAVREVYGVEPEDIDRDFLVYVRDHVKGLRIEPRWTPARVARMRASLPATAPTDPAARARYVDDVCTVAWGTWQQQKKVDTQEALRRIKDVTPQPARALFLRGGILLTEGNRESAVEMFRAAIAAGGEDFKARIALAAFAHDAGDLEGCERELLAAEKAFPGYDDKDLCAELRLAELYDEQERTDDAMAARERWIAWDAGEVKMRLLVARWHAEKGRTDRAIALFTEANEIDPFLRSAHRDWADALRAAKRYSEAEREYRMTLAVPPELDAEDQVAYDDEDRAELMGSRSACLLEAGRKDEARTVAEAALKLDDGCSTARETLERLK